MIKWRISASSPWTISASVREILPVLDCELMSDWGIAVCTHEGIRSGAIPISWAVQFFTSEASGNLINSPLPEEEDELGFADDLCSSPLAPGSPKETPSANGLLADSSGLPAGGRSNERPKAEISGVLGFTRGEGSSAGTGAAGVTDSMGAPTRAAMRANGLGTDSAVTGGVDAGAEGKAASWPGDLALGGAGTGAGASHGKG